MANLRKTSHSSTFIISMPNQMEFNFLYSTKIYDMKYIIYDKIYNILSAIYLIGIIHRSPFI